MDPSDEARRSSEITGLLFKAVKKGLPDDEQRAVFEYFLERGIGLAQPAAFGPLLRGDLRAAIGSGAWPDPSTLFTAQKPMGPQQSMIPVRLSEAQHQRLKQWCAEHNFPMAVVVRGLIERFLDGFQKRAV